MAPIHLWTLSCVLAIAATTTLVLASPIPPAATDQCLDHHRTAYLSSVLDGLMLDAIWLIKVDQNDDSPAVHATLATSQKEMPVGVQTYLSLMGYAAVPGRIPDHRGTGRQCAYFPSDAPRGNFVAASTNGTAPVPRDRHMVCVWDVVSSGGGAWTPSTPMPEKMA